MGEPAVLEKVLYTASATSTGGREGRSKSDDGILDLALVPPKSLGGSGGPGTNPEQLFAAGYSACFASAVGHVARLQRIKTGTIVVAAKVSIGPVGQAFGLAVELTASIPDVTKEQAQQLLETANAVCPYSCATHGNIVVDVKLVT